MANLIIEFPSIKELKTDEKGFKHYTLVPKVNNVDVYKQKIKVHVNKQGKVIMVNGNIDQDKILPSNSVVLTKDEAIDNAFKSINQSVISVSNFDKSNPVNEAKLNVSSHDNKYI